jgi:acyl carrier protein
MNKINSIDALEIQIWLQKCLASLLNVQPEQIAIDVPFDRYGLESSDAAGISADLEDWLGCELGDPLLLYEYNTIATFAEFAAGLVNKSPQNHP